MEIHTIGIDLAKTRSQPCVPIIRQRLKTTLTGLPKQLDRRRCMQLLNCFHHRRRRGSTTESFAQP
jgi:hypothetical protein